MLLIDLIPTDRLWLNFKSLMWSSLKDFVALPRLFAYMFHTWTPCWLISPVSCPGLWKLRLPSQGAMNKKFHVFSAKSIISSMVHISVGGRASQWPREASANIQALTHWFQIASMFPLSSHFYFISLFTLIRDLSTQFAKWWFSCV